MIATSGSYCRLEPLASNVIDKEMHLSDYRDYDDALARLGHFLDEVYTHKRIHSALGYLTPAAYEQQWRAQQQNRGSGIH